MPPPKMLHNYHTHTTRCGHASGTEREYIETAIAAGYKTLGFSDHAPMPFPDGHESGYRIQLNRTDDYFSILSDLKAEYRSDITIHIGLEAEFYPAHFERFLDYLAPYPLEYLIMGQHFVFDELGPSSGSATDDPATLQLYLSTVLQGVETGRFLYIAHPDLINFTGSDETYAALVRPFLKRLKTLGIPLEINRLGYSDHRHYPSDRFFRLAGEIGNTAVIGVDAHDPSHLLDTPAIDGCIAMAHRFNLPILEDPGKRFFH